MAKETQDTETGTTDAVSSAYSAGLDGPRYKCGCPVTRDSGRSDEQWLVFEPRCSEHDEGPDWSSITK